MTCSVFALRFGARDPARLAEFWSGVLGWPADGLDPTVLVPNDDTGFVIDFFSLLEPKIGSNQMHVDLTSTSLEDQRQTVARALRLGARHHDVGQREDEEHVVLADPEGNEFCVIEPGNAFLADCGFIGALAGDGSQRVGYFWSEALGWPLVWDQDEETAIRSPQGGPKITWGGPPVAPTIGPTRLRFDLVPPTGGDRPAEVDRLVALGASLLGGGTDNGHRVRLTDPDGNELGVLKPT